MKKKTHEEYTRELEDKDFGIIAIEQYVNNSTPILHYCIEHGIYWKTTPGRILNGRGCPQCKKEKFRRAMCKTHEKYVDELKEKLPHIVAIEKYVDKSTHIMHYCTKHDMYWSATPDNVLHSNGCPLCRNETIGNKLKKTHQQYIEELKQYNHNIEVIGEYVGANTQILHRCKIDGYEWFATPANILFGCGCPKCKTRKLSNMFSKSHAEYVRELSVVNSNLEVLGEYINAKIPILHRCKIDGYEWEAAPSNILSGQGCPKCQTSKGEKQIHQWLENNNITYVYQKTFTDCKDKKELPFDFYLPRYNLCIEFDGRQHFEPVDFSGKGQDWALEQFLITQKHDEMKNQYCNDNNIRLLRIPYYKNIESELETFLFI